MTNYLISVKCNAPYPVEKRYTEQRSNIAAATGAAIRRWRKDFAKKRIKELSIKVIQQ